MIKRLTLLSAMLAGSASAQQNMDISEKDVTSGAAQARLSALARDAAASGKRVVVTAPQHLHAQIAAGLSAGGKADIVLKDGFYENVLVRVVDAPLEEPAKPEVATTAPRPAAPPVRAPTPAQPPPRPVPRAVPAPVAPLEAPVPAPSSAAAKDPPSTPAPAVAAPDEALDLAVPPVPPAPVAAPATRSGPAPADAAASAPQALASGVFVAAEPGDVSPARLSLEKLYNDGKRINETIAPNRLINGDLIYTGNGAAVVVRRERPSMLRFWLDGRVDLGQSAIVSEGKNKYRVIGGSVR